MLSTKAVLNSMLSLAVASMMMLTTGCEDDDKDTPTGTATVRGEVTNVSTAYAPGALAGITVHLVGDVTLKTVSNEQGIFEFANVPAGDFVLIFFVNGGEASKPITVAEGQTTVLAHVYVNGRGEVIVTTDSITAPAPEPAPEPDPVIEVAGKWIVSPAKLHAVDYSPTYQLELQQEGATLSGTLTTFDYYVAHKPSMAPVYTVSGTIVGTAVELALIARDLSGKRAYYWESMSGTVNADGTAMSGSYAGEGDLSGTWTAARGVVPR
jgi:hypothetical protein